MTQPTAAAALELLAAAGYQVNLRTGDYVECLVRRQREHWAGRGRTEAEALADVLGRMVPSHFGRMLLATPPPAPPVEVPVVAEAVATAPAEVATALEQVTTAPEEVATHLEEVATHPEQVATHPEQVATHPEQVATHPEQVATHPEQVATHPEQVATHPEQVTTHPEEVTTHPEEVATHPEEVTTAPEEVATAPGEVATAPAEGTTAPAEVATAPAEETPEVALVARATVPPPGAVKAVAELDGILAEVEDLFGGVGRLAPDLQRAYFFIWVARMRRMAEAGGADREVQKRVTVVNRRLADFVQAYWPGSGREMAFGPRAAEVLAFQVGWAPAPRSWAEAEEIAHATLDRQLTACEAEGLDPEGWADTPQGAGGKTGPDRALVLAVKAIDAVLAARAEVGARWTPEDADLEKLLGAARKLRAVRGMVEDDLAWGKAMGNLRRVLPALGKRGAKIKEAIDPRFKG